nr:hypothetical protein [Bacillus gaemokensis]
MRLKTKCLSVAALSLLTVSGGGSAFAAEQSIQNEQKMVSGIIYLDKDKPNLPIHTLGENLKLITTVTSEARPQSGQKNRSSGNFAVESLPSGTYALKWTAPAGVYFNVMRDKSGGKDPVVLSGVSDGTTSSPTTSRSYYIANPSGAFSDFNVSVYAVYP